MLAVSSGFFAFRACTACILQDAGLELGLEALSCVFMFASVSIELQLLYKFGMLNWSVDSDLVLRDAWSLEGASHQ